MPEKPDKTDFQRWIYLFQPDILAPVQYHDIMRGNRYLPPEKRLMLAVLEDAVVCFQKYVSASSRSGKKQFSEAENWFFSEPNQGLYSIDNVCEILGLSPSYIRTGLMRWKEKKLHTARRIQEDRRGSSDVNDQHKHHRSWAPVNMREGLKHSQDLQ
jgi:hypothetical protein